MVGGGDGGQEPSFESTVRSLNDSSPAEVQPVSFKEGDRVVLKDVIKTELNGQKGIIMHLGEHTRERLPVKLDKTGQGLKIKPKNLDHFPGRKALEHICAKSFKTVIGDFRA